MVEYQIQDPAPAAACLSGLSLANLFALMGKRVCIKTVTLYYVGRVVGYDADAVYLDDAAWVSDTGRWSAALTTGTVEEAEAYPPEQQVAVCRGGIVEFTVWSFPTPTTH